MSGSLLGVELNGIASAPVGYLTVMRMYPMDFEEFMLANDEKITYLPIYMSYLLKEEQIDSQIIDIINSGFESRRKFFRRLLHCIDMMRLSINGK